jgi:hypothetical protein
MLDGDGNIRHLPMAGGYFEQDWKHLEIINEIRSEYIRLMEAKIKGK